MNAFPTPMIPIDKGGYTEVRQEGMSLLDYFAAKALQGCLAYYHENPHWGNYQLQYDPVLLSKHCYDIAEAMLKESENRYGKSR